MQIITELKNNNDLKKLSQAFTLTEKCLISTGIFQVFPKAELGQKPQIFESVIFRADKIWDLWNFGPGADINKWNYELIKQNKN